MIELGSHDDCIYFIHEEKTGLIKIGFTNHLSDRMRALACRSNRIELLGVMHGSHRLEREIHVLFSQFRKKRERFLPSPLLLEFIAANTLPCGIGKPVPDFLTRKRGTSHAAPHAACPTCGRPY